MYDNYPAVAECWSSIVCFAVWEVASIRYKCVGDISVDTMQDCVWWAWNLICNCTHPFACFIWLCSDEAFWSLMNQLKQTNPNCDHRWEPWSCICTNVVSDLFAWSVWSLFSLRAEVSASDRASVTWDLIAFVMFEFIIIFDSNHMQSAIIFAYAAHITLASAFECMTMYLLHCHKCIEVRCVALRCRLTAYYIKQFIHWVEI